MYFETPYIYSTRIISSHIVLCIFKARICIVEEFLAVTLSYVFENTV